MALELVVCKADLEFIRVVIDDMDAINVQTHADMLSLDLSEGVLGWRRLYLTIEEDTSVEGPLSTLLYMCVCVCVHLTEAIVTSEKTA